MYRSLHVLGLGSRLERRFFFFLRFVSFFLRFISFFGVSFFCSHSFFLLKTEKTGGFVSGCNWFLMAWCLVAHHDGGRRQSARASLVRPPPSPTLPKSPTLLAELQDEASCFLYPVVAAVCRKFSLVFSVVFSVLVQKLCFCFCFCCPAHRRLRVCLPGHARACLPCGGVSFRSWL